MFGWAKYIEYYNSLNPYILEFNVWLSLKMLIITCLFFFLNIILDKQKYI